MVVTLFNKNTLDFGKVQVVITQPFFIESFWNFDSFLIDLRTDGIPSFIQFLFWEVRQIFAQNSPSLEKHIVGAGKHT